ncbi:MAG: leucyl/phenylalanyl-tRNA--protein transferase [Alphaproteobacteria bacterium]|nr:leucyl/phenylalanyl-tRNA--protein transferase [Alphaproteobacteria bacterium]
MQIVLTPEILLEAYAQGLFPMARSGHSPYIDWYCPKNRGQLSITQLHIPKKLGRMVKKMEISGAPYEIRIDTEFESVMRNCAMTNEEEHMRKETWINEDIIKVFCKLHEMGYAHSVECWQGGQLTGGLYGLAIGGLFCGESMFSTAPNTSKACLIHLVARLWKKGYSVLDTQFVNDHLLQFGVYEVPYESYLEQLEHALRQDCTFKEDDEPSEPELVREYLEGRLKNS